MWRAVVRQHLHCFEPVEQLDPSRPEQQREKVSVQAEPSHCGSVPTPSWAIAIGPIWIVFVNVTCL
jgi:hypothetical protein